MKYNNYLDDINEATADKFGGMEWNDGPKKNEVYFRPEEYHGEKFIMVLMNNQRAFLNKKSVDELITFLTKNKL